MIATKERFERLKIFGNDKKRLALLMFFDKNDGASKVSVSQLDNSELGHRKVNIELEGEDEIVLDNLFDELQRIKKSYDFSNLDNYLKSSIKNMNSMDKLENMDVAKIKIALDLYCLSNFFKQTPHIANINFLNYKDDVFVRRFDEIIEVF